MGAKVTCYFIPFFIFLFGLDAAQAQSPLKQLIEFSCTDCDPAQALIALSRQSGVNISFNDRFFENCPAVSLDAKKRTLEQHLLEIIACAEVGYRVIDNQIILFRKARRFIWNGYVQDAHNGERLIGAAVRLVNGKSGGMYTNEFGFFSLSLDAGIYDAVVSYIGYQDHRVRVDLSESRTTVFRLQPNAELPEVVISELNTADASSKARKSALNLPTQKMRSLPMPGGEADLMRVAALQPGIHTGVDGLGGLHVRGGNSDQNLILLDDVPVYNPSHALGLFSIFNPGTVNNARLWKGDFPARYGGRVASVLDVRTRDGNMRDYRAELSSGLLASSLTLEGPIIKDRSSFLIGARITYFNPWLKWLGQRDTLLNLAADEASYRFFDVNVKWNYILSSKNRLFLSFYRGGDGFVNDFSQTSVTNNGSVLEEYDLSSDWGNEIFALRWNHVLTNNLFVNTTLRSSRFYYNSQLRFISTLYDNFGRERQLENYAQLYGTLIRDWSGKTDFTFFPRPELTLRWGAAVTLHDFKPGALSVNFSLPGQAGTSLDSLSNLLENNERLVADESEAYIDAEFTLAKNWQFEAGLNASLFQIQNQSYGAAQPRIRVQYTGKKGWRYWSGYHRSVQNLHQIGSFNISLPFELWVPTTPKVPPEKVAQFSLGIGRQTEGWSWQIEGYYKHLERVLTLLSSNLALYTGGAEDASGWEDRIASGYGYARGLEFLLQKNTGKCTGSVAYTWSYADRTFEDVNSGRTFPFRFDRRHDLKITLQQQIFSWMSAGAVWQFATGSPITLATVRYEQQTPGSDVVRNVYVYDSVNGYRLPVYHRLDLSVNVQWASGRWEHAFSAGGYNVYNRANPFFLYLAPYSNSPGKAVQYTLLPFLPVLSYNLKW